MKSSVKTLGYYQRGASTARFLVGGLETAVPYYMNAVGATRGRLTSIARLGYYGRLA